MSIVKDMKTAWKNVTAPKTFRSQMVVDDGNAKVSVLHTEGSEFVTIEIQNLDSTVSVDLDNHSGLSGLVVTSTEMRYGTHSGSYTIKANAGGKLLVGQDKRNVTITAVKGKETAVATFTPMQFETLMPMLRSYYRQG